MYCIANSVVPVRAVQPKPTIPKPYPSCIEMLKDKIEVFLAADLCIINGMYIAVDVINYNSILRTEE